MLAGAIVGLRAQGLQPFEAAVAGSWLHGLAGLRAAELLKTTASVTAGDVLELLPEAVAQANDPPLRTNAMAANARAAIKSCSNYNCGRFPAPARAAIDRPSRSASSTDSPLITLLSPGLDLFLDLLDRTPHCLPVLRLMITPAGDCCASRCRSGGQPRGNRCANDEPHDHARKKGGCFVTLTAPSPGHALSFLTDFGRRPSSRIAAARAGCLMPRAGPRPHPPSAPRT